MKLVAHSQCAAVKLGQSEGWTNILRDLIFSDQRAKKHDFHWSLRLIESS